MSKSSPHSDSSSSSSSESLSSLSSLKTPEEIAHEVFLMRLTDPNSSIPGSLNKIELAYIPNEKKSTEIGHFILPTAAIRGDGTSDDYFPPEVPALPSFKLHKFVSDKILNRNLEYRTGVIYTTNRRVWEWDNNFKKYLKKLGAIGIDMETATLFIVGYANQIARGALLLVSDLPMIPDGVKTEESDRIVTQKFVDLHLEIGIEAMTELEAKGEQIKHFTY